MTGSILDVIIRRLQTSDYTDYTDYTDVNPRAVRVKYQYGGKYYCYKATLINQSIN